MPAPPATVVNALEMIKSDPSKILGLKTGPHESITPGQKIPRKDATSPPQVSFDVPDGTYLIVELDLDAPFNSFPFLSPILHWIAPGYTKQESNILNSMTPAIASYAPPGPPPGSGPHRYVFLLYEQPENFNAAKYAAPEGKEMGIRPRIRFDYATFEKDLELGPVLAANYYASN
ncbi:putative protease inhibitor [Xylogone sp. PMI_703]|nr:putative protease inhibitor [Xylogone sp. PMI_703]